MAAAAASVACRVGWRQQISELPDVKAAAGIGGTGVNLLEPGDDKPNGTIVIAVDPTQAADTLAFGFTAGGWADLGADGILVSKQHADDAGIGSRRPRST